MVELSANNIDLYCIQAYNSDRLDILQYKIDMKRLRSIVKAFVKYNEKNIIKERVVLNNIICFFNVFDVVKGINILLYFVNKSHYSYLLPFLIYLGYINEEDMENHFAHIQLDKHLISKLREI